MDPKPYYLQEPRPSFWRKTDARQCIIHSIDLALDNKDREWFMELTDRLLEIEKDLLTTGPVQ